MDYNNLTFTKRAFFLKILTAIIVIGLITHVQAAVHVLVDEPVGFQQNLQAASVELPGGFPASMRHRSVHISPGIMVRENIKTGDVLLLNLFDDTDYEAVIDKVSENINGTLMMRGRLQEFPFASVTISSTEGRLLASVYIPETKSHYLIQSDEQGVHYVLDLDTAAMDALEDMPALIPVDELTDQASLQEESQQALAGPLDTYNIDVMILYTPAAQSWASSSGGGINNVIAQAIQKTQEALDNSNTYLTVTLAHSSLISYTESGSMDTDLDRLTFTSDGYMDDIHSLRDQYGADLVTLFTDADDYGGLAWLLNSSSGSPSYGFSVNRVQQVGWTYTTAHEWGHNMGCGHNKDQGSWDGLFSYSAGWRWVGSDSERYHSVMSYDDNGDTEVGYFSNPGVTHLGTPTGDAVDGDCARTIREVKDNVASYRDSVTIPDPTPPIAMNDDITVTEPNGVVIELIATDDGYPVSPGKLSYSITSLPEHGWLFDPNDGLEIMTTPYTLQNDGNSVIYEPCPYYFTGTDGFTFKANDGGDAPDGGDSNIADVNLVMNMLSDTVFELDVNTNFFYVPFQTQYKQSRTQLIYLAEEIGGQPKHITEIALRVVGSELGYTVPNIELQNWTIRMQHTEMDAYPASGQFINDGWVTVYDVNEPPLTAGWNTFKLETPFDYNGTSNLLVDMSFNNSQTTGQPGYVYQSDTATKRKLFKFASTTENPLDWTTPTTQLLTYTRHVCNMIFKSGSATDILYADFNYNCSVGAEDLLTMIDTWLAQEGDADYNSDCDISIQVDKKVNLADFAMLASEWLLAIE